MPRRPPAAIWLPALLALTSSHHRDARAEDPPRRPNIVWILADDLGHADPGFQGGRDAPTPHLDALAAGGVRCSNGYVSHPFCSPTRAGLMTGRYQQRFGHENNPSYLPEDDGVGLPVDQVFVARRLRDAGYATGAVGKWHLGAAPRFHPLERGFGEYFGFLGGGHQYFPVPPARAEYSIPILRGREPVAEPEYLTDAFGREAAAFVERHKHEPFFLYLAFNAVHTPMQAPRDVEAKYDTLPTPVRRTHAAMLDAMDRAIGRILDALHANDLERDTLVVFLSDNGGPIDVNGSSNAPLRGAKGSVYEGGIRVPFVLRWPARLSAGTTFDQPVISLDLAPTAMAAAGLDIPEDARFDGTDLLPHLTAQRKDGPHESLHWRTGGGQAWAIREGPWKLLRARANDPELYDLSADIGESRNLAADKPELVARLTAAHEAWNAELVPPLWQSPQAGQPKAQAKKAARRKAAASLPSRG